MPVLVIGVTVGQERGDRLGYFLIGEDIPETVSSQHEDVIGAMLVLRERVNFNLQVKRMMTEKSELRCMEPT